MRSLGRWFSLVVLVFATTACPAGQKSSVRVFGNVRDPSGVAIPGVELHVKPDCKCSDCSIPDECKCCPPQVTVTTNEAGQYEVRIPPGNYSFKARDTQIKVTVEDRDKNVNITVNDPPQ